MRDYRLYGISIRSEMPLPFPETPAGHTVDVTFSAAPHTWFATMTTGLPNLGRADDWHERRRGADGSDFLHFPDLFEFMVSPDGRSVTYAQLQRSTVESFQTYLLGHVLSFALVKQELEPLHATVVVVEGAAVAFLGSSGQGKSTLAAAFLHAGHRVLTDDLLVIRDEGELLVGFPGPPRLKLFSHIAQRFLPGQAASAPMNPDTQKLIIPLQPAQAHVGPAPIHGFLVLDEGEASSTGVHLTELSGRDSVLQLLGSTFNTRLVTPDRLRRQFLAARNWATRVPVKRLEYPRAVSGIDQVRAAIIADIRSASMLLS